MMSLSKKQLQTLQRLIAGESVPASILRDDIAKILTDEELLTVRANGSRRSFKAIDTASIRQFLASRFEELADTDLTKSIVYGQTLSRAEQASITGNSKLIKMRTCPGFPINTYEPIVCKLNENKLIVNPSEGSFLFVTDWQRFEIPRNVVVVGIENMENFRKIHQQRHLFHECINTFSSTENKQLLFVSRYPQSTDLRQWLQQIPNIYFHFGDFDLAGINIFLTEFQKYLGDRSTFLIPPDIESRIIRGTTTRYNDQYEKFHNLTSSDPKIQHLINLINKYHRCYDQE